MASPQSILSPYQTQVDHSANSLALSSSSSSTRTTASSPSLLASISPSTQVFQNENNQILSSIDILNDDQCQLSNKSNSRKNYRNKTKIKISIFEILLMFSS